MMRHLFLAIGILLALCGMARADDAACDGPALTPTQWAAQSDADRIQGFERLVRCAEQGIAAAGDQVRRLSGANIAESANTWLGERDHFKALLESCTAQLTSAQGDIVALTGERTALQAEVATLTAALEQARAENEGHLDALKKANVRIAELTADRDRFSAGLDDANRTIAEGQAALDAANARIKALTDEADRWKAEVEAANEKIAALQASLDEANGKIGELGGEIDRLNAALKDAGDQTRAVQAALDGANTTITGQKGDIDRLNAALKAANDRIAALEQQVADAAKNAAALQAAIDAANGRTAEVQKQLDAANAANATLTTALNDANDEIRKLKDQIDSLAKVRSEFFARLREILGNRDDISIVGDRFVIQSEVLFATGSAALDADGTAQIVKVASVIASIQDQIPSNIDWVLQVNGHTDSQPILRGGKPGKKFADNWELSTARALSVLELLIANGVSPLHVAAAGFGEFHPLVEGDTPDALAQNRRIELKLTDDGLK